MANQNIIDTEHLTAADINKLSAKEADQAFRYRLNSEMLNAPHGQEQPFKYAGREIEAYYNIHRNDINKSKLETSEKDLLIKALVIKFMNVIQKNSGQIDSLITSAQEITNFYAPELQRQ